MSNPGLTSGPAALVAWLQEQALRGASGGEILQGLCERLLGSPIGLERAVVGYLVYHPQFDGMNFTWTRDTNSTERQSATLSNILRQPSPFLHMQATGLREMRCRLGTSRAPVSFPSLENLRSRGFTDYFAYFELFGSAADQTVWPELPAGMVMHEGVTGSFATTRAGGFTDDEITTFRALVPALAVAVRVGALIEMAETLLGAYLGHATGQRVFRGHARRGQGQVIRAVVWHSDLRGSTHLAEAVPIETYLAALNHYYECVVDAVVEHGGEVLKFIGDGILAMFAFSDGVGDLAAERALAAATGALHRLERVNVERGLSGHREIRCGIAIHAGNVMYGNVGSERRLDFTVMGPAVNEVVRLESLCKRLDVPIIVSDNVKSLCGRDLLPLGRFSLPGVAREMDVYSGASAEG